ncbi:MAG: class I SAM-dependent methyltransferase [Anaerolineae bacterium]
MLKSAWFRLVRFGFRLLYNEMAWSYDVVSWLVSLGAWREWQRTAWEFVHGGNVLELGHGPGHLLAALGTAGCSVAGLDLSPAMGRIAQRRWGKAGPPAPLVRGRAQALPFRAVAFDTVLATFPTDYIADPETVAGIYRVLKPGGRLVVVPESRLHKSTPLHRLIEWLFTITGQRRGAAVGEPSSEETAEARWALYARPFTVAGFQVTIRQRRLATSAVTILIAEKLVDS